MGLVPLDRDHCGTNVPVHEPLRVVPRWNAVHTFVRLKFRNCALLGLGCVVVYTCNIELAYFLGFLVDWGDIV